jgi:hypothetical protein
MPKRPDRTPDELKKLAQDYIGGQIYTDRDIPGSPETVQRLMPMVFLPLALLGAKAARTLRAEKPVLIFEYLHERGMRSVNGCPQFFSCRFMNEREFRQWRELVTQIQAAIAAIPAAPPKPKRKRRKSNGG